MTPAPLTHDLTSLWKAAHPHLIPLDKSHILPLPMDQHHRCGLCGFDAAFDVIADLAGPAPGDWKGPQPVRFCPNCQRFSISQAEWSARCLQQGLTKSSEPPVAVNARLWSSSPTFLNIEPTTRCNFSCWYCVGRYMKQEDIVVSSFEKVFAHFPSLKTIALVGEGEPLMHKGFFEMVEMATQRGIAVGTITNGSTLSTSNIRKLCESGIRYISVSIDSIRSEQFASSRIGGDLDKVMKNIQNLARFRDENGFKYPRIGLKGTLFRETQNELPDIVALAKKNGVDVFEGFQALNMKESYVKIYPASKVGEYEVVDTVLSKILEKSEKISTTMKHSSTFFMEDGIEAYSPEKKNGLRQNCDEQWLYALLSGNVTPCCQIKEPIDVSLNLFERPVDAILADPIYENVRFHLWNGLFPISCRGCSKTRPPVKKIDRSEKAPLLSKAQSNHIPLRPFPTLPKSISKNHSPLVSLLIRSAQRSTLTRALDSVALQTYSNIEVLLVNALDTPHPPLPDRCGRFPLRLIHADGGQKRTRPEAANEALKAAQGTWCLFLDDDDVIFPDHVEKLVRHVLAHSGLGVVHTGAQAITEAGEEKGRFEFDLPAPVLFLTNFIPIHTALFSKAVVIENGICFDESLTIYEDWDFWLQLAQKTAFGFIGGISACYYISETEEHAVHSAVQTQWRERIREKWLPRLSDQGAERLNALLFEGREALHHKNLEIAERIRSHETLEEALKALDLRVHQSQGQVTALEAEVKETHEHRYRAEKAMLEQQERARHFEAEFYRTQGHLEASHAQIHSLGTELQAAHGQIHSLGTELQAAHGQIHSLGTELQAAHGQIHSLGTELQAAHGQIHSVRAELEASRVHGDHLQQALTTTIRDFETSLSWKITAPLRAVAERVLPLWRTGTMALRLGGGFGKTLRLATAVLQREGWQGIAWRLSNARKITEASPAQPPQSMPSPSPFAPASERSYAQWVALYDTLDDTGRASLRKTMSEFQHRPRFSIIMPVYDPPLDFLAQAIVSVKNQIYPEWELCIADDASKNPEVRRFLQHEAEKEPRIRCVFREENGHISAASNSALTLASGDFVALMDNDDLLPEQALFWVAQAIHQHPDAALLYSDEDKIDAENRRFDPHFKSDFNPELFLAQNMISHLGVFRRSLVEAVGGFRTGFEGAQDYDLALRVVEQITPAQIVHIPRILYHWRAIAGSTALEGGEKNYAADAGRRAVCAHLERTGKKATVSPTPETPAMNRVRFALPDTKPLVSLIIPTRDRIELLSMCLDSILEKTTYPRFEIIVIDNASTEPESLRYFEAIQKKHAAIRVIRDERSFNFSALNNAGARAAQGEVLCLMNNDIEILSPDWMEEMLGFALQPEVGCVGARLWYPDGRLQHGGVILGIGGIAGHSHKFLPKGEYGYFSRGVLHQALSAVTAACLMIRKSVFDEVDGLDEELAVAFNDVDFCLRVRKAGYRNVWTPYAEMNHHESASRGYETTPEKQQRFAQEIHYTQARWGKTLYEDPFYNLNLTHEHEDFSLAFPPRHGLTPL